MSAPTLAGCVAPCGWCAPEDFITIDPAHIGLIVPAPGKTNTLHTVVAACPRVLDAAESLALRARAIAYVREYFRARSGWGVEILHTCVAGDRFEVGVEVIYQVTAPAPEPVDFQWRHLRLPPRPRDRRSCRPRLAMPRMGVS